ncbi:hypothetical protein [Brevundimonas sp.]|uniref:hypothetical protein n=1 Tax=Brevundimonas sp. TaxID=1871086 RepID=UPI002D2A28C4|nr:hypothetical protein [Brevundimonas sp.]HYD26123.1 hypothetical protein [Brevundimonas sp.]
MRSTALHVGFAFVAMGGWAAFANRDHGAGAVLLAFVVQGALSGLITLVMKRGLEAGHARLSGLSARLAPPLISCTLVAALLYGVHTAASTPEVIRTIALPWTVSTLYAFIYVASLERVR